MKLLQTQIVRLHNTPTPLKQDMDPFENFNYEGIHGWDAERFVLLVIIVNN